MKSFAHLTQDRIDVLSNTQENYLKAYKTAKETGDSFEEIYRDLKKVNK